MKLQDQVCILDQATRLKELGVVQKSLFYYHPAFDKPVFGETWTWTTVTGKQYKKTMICNDKHGSSSAFTVAELGVMLPNYYPSWRFKPKDFEPGTKWITTIICKPKPSGVDDIHTAPEFDRYADTQAQALAILLIALLEEKVITVDEVNERLSK